MSVGLLARKVGMTQLYTEEGVLVGATVLTVGPCVVVQRKTQGKDGYDAVQLGLVEARPPKHVTKPQQGHFKKAATPPLRKLAEFPIQEDSELKAGDELTVAAFKEGEVVHVTGISKGKGFQGVMKRHNFAGGKASHGSMHHRAPGSIGQSSYPSRVFKGVKLPGQMGSERVTVRGLKVIKVDEERNLLLVKGGVPGAKGSYLKIRTAGSK